MQDGWAPTKPCEAAHVCRSRAPRPVSCDGWSGLAQGRAHALVSRALDELEETRLVPARKVLYQFTSRGHDVTQVLLAQQLTGAATASVRITGRDPCCSRSVSASTRRWRRR
jgi:2-oxoisovalerate dehydrogenase E1 component